MDSKKRITLTFDLADEQQRLVYEVLNESGRKKTNVVCDAMALSPEVVVRTCLLRMRAGNIPDNVSSNINQHKNNNDNKQANTNKHTQADDGDIFHTKANEQEHTNRNINDNINANENYNKNEHVNTKDNYKDNEGADEKDNTDLDPALLMQGLNLFSDEMSG